MRRAFSLVGLVLLGVTVSCSLLLDYGSLQGGTSTGAGGAATGGGAGGTTGGGGGTDGDASTPSVPLPDLAGALARAICDNLDACYGSAIELFVHDDDCKTLFTNIIAGQIVAPIEQSVARGIVGYDPRQAAACVMNLVDDTHKTPPVCANLSALGEDCKRMLSNLASAGRPCRHRFECKEGLVCDDTVGCPGTCKPFAQVGAPCAADDDCDPSKRLFCQKSADAGPDVPAAGTCQPFVALNGDCSDRDRCEPGAFCLDRKCKRVSDVLTLAETFTCYSNSLLCQKGLDCEFNGLPFLSMGTCVKEKQPLDVCKVALPDECPKDTYCSANGFNGGGQCVGTPVENQKCATDFEQSIGLAAPCKAGLVCVNGICKPSRQLGEPCETNAQCYSMACLAPDGGTGICRPLGCP
jgi:hypothetical protein